MKLWTSWCEYFATGEGLSIMAQITYAENEQQALKQFEERFGNWYRQGAEATEGVVRNHITEFVFSKKTLDFCDKEQGNCNIDFYSSGHFNYS